MSAIPLLQARLLSKLRSPYIIQHYDSFTDQQEVLNIVMEFASGGTVYHVTRAQQGRLLAEDRIWKWLIQSLLALDYIHRKRIVHRDIKSLNLFLDAGDNIKMGDFGIARTLGDGTDVLRTIVGTCGAVSTCAQPPLPSCRPEPARVQAVLPVAGAVRGQAVQREDRHLGARRVAGARSRRVSPLRVRGRGSS